MATTVYRHRRLDTNEIFYVGIGRERRPYSKKDRNEHWKNIVSKYGYTVEIIAEDLSKEDACELEVFLISLYGRRDLNKGNLVNLTDGGDGVKGITSHLKGCMGDKHPAFGNKHSEEWKVNRKTWITRKGHKMNGSLNGMSKKIINEDTGEIFNSVTEASISVDIKRTTLSAMLNGQNKNKTKLKYIL